MTCESCPEHKELTFLLRVRNLSLATAWTENSRIRDWAQKQGAPAEMMQFAIPNMSQKIGYVFLHKRPLDKQAWPVLYEDQKLAEACQFRVSDIVPVILPEIKAGPGA